MCDNCSDPYGQEVRRGGLNRLAVTMLDGSSRGIRTVKVLILAINDMIEVMLERLFEMGRHQVRDSEAVPWRLSDSSVTIV